MALAVPTPTRGSPRALTERGLLAFLSLASVVALLRWRTAPSAPWVLLVYLLSATLIGLLRHPDAKGVDRLIGVVYPLFLLPVLYASLDLLTSVDTVNVHDPLVRSWEVWIFGTQVSQEFWRAYPSRLLSLVFHAAYLAYYVIVPLPPLALLARGQWHDASFAVGLTTVTFLVCFLIFLVFPVAGPYYEFPRPDHVVLDNAVASAVYGLLGQGSSYGAAFPSSHIAATVAATAGALIGWRPLGWTLVIPTVLMTVGVVYTQMHYAVDALAGLLVAGIVVGWYRVLVGKVSAHTTTPRSVMPSEAP